MIVERMKKVSELKLVFHQPEDIMEFVNVVQKYPYDMDMKKGRIVVDAKSLLGLMNLGLQQEVELQIYEEHCEDLKEAIQKFAA